MVLRELVSNAIRLAFSMGFFATTSKLRTSRFDAIAIPGSAITPSMR